mgnify:CR=1 FL=1
MTDVNNDVTEPAAEDNNVGASDPIAVTLAPVPDLAVIAVSGPAQVGVGESFTVDWTVQNVGGVPAPAGSWNDEVYLSPDGTLSGATLLGTFRYFAGLPPDATVDRSETVEMPVQSDDDFFLVVRTDAQDEVFERGS